MPPWLHPWVRARSKETSVAHAVEHGDRARVGELARAARAPPLLPGEPIARSDRPSPSKSPVADRESELVVGLARARDRVLRPEDDRCIRSSPSRSSRRRRSGPRRYPFSFGTPTTRSSLPSALKSPAVEREAELVVGLADVLDTGGRSAAAAGSPIPSPVRRRRRSRTPLRRRWPRRGFRPRGRRSRRRLRSPAASAPPMAVAFRAADRKHESAVEDIRVRRSVVDLYAADRAAADDVPRHADREVVEEVIVESADREGESEYLVVDREVGARFPARAEGWPRVWPVRRRPRRARHRRHRCPARCPQLRCRRGCLSPDRQHRRR